MAVDRRVELTKLRGLNEALRQVVIDFCHENWASRINGEFKIEEFDDHWPNIYHNLKDSGCKKKHRLVHLNLLAQMAGYIEELASRYEKQPFQSARHSELLSKYIDHYLRQLGILYKTKKTKIVIFTVKGKETEVKGLLGKKKSSSLAKKIGKHIVDGFDSNLLTTEVKNYGVSIENALRGTPDIDISQLPMIPRCCAFKGGGMMGLAYIGSIRAMHRIGLLPFLHQVAGTSGGALLATGFALGMDDVEMEQFLLSFTPENIIRPLTVRKPLRVLRLVHNFIRKRSLFKDDKLRKFLSSIIQNATGIEHITFLQLHELVLQQDSRTGSENAPFRLRDLIIIGTNATTRSRLEFSWRKHPHLRIDDALRISVSIPGYFPEVKAVINKEGHFILREDGSLATESTADDHRQVKCYDGGMMLNYPLYVWDGDFERQDVIGFYLQDNSMANHRIPHIALGQRVINTMMRASERPNDENRTIMIPPTKGLKATTWHFKKRTMQEAELKGFVSTINFFKERIHRAQQVAPTALQHNSHARYEEYYLLLLEKCSRLSSQIFMDRNIGGQPCTVQLLFHGNHQIAANKMAESYYMLPFMVNDFHFGVCNAGYLISCSLKTQRIIKGHVEWIRAHQLTQVAAPFDFDDLVDEPLNFEELDKNRMKL